MVNPFTSLASWFRSKNYLINEIDHQIKLNKELEYEVESLMGENIELESVIEDMLNSDEGEEDEDNRSLTDVSQGGQKPKIQICFNMYLDENFEIEHLFRNHNDDTLEQLTALLYSIHSGKLMASSAQAIKEYGKNSPENKEFSDSVLKIWTEMLQDDVNNAKEDEFDDESPVVSPYQVLNPPRHE